MNKNSFFSLFLFYFYFHYLFLLITRVSIQFFFLLMFGMCSFIRCCSFGSLIFPFHLCFIFLVAKNDFGVHTVCNTNQSFCFYFVGCSCMIANSKLYEFVIWFQLFWRPVSIHTYIYNKVIVFFFNVFFVSIKQTSLLSDMITTNCVKCLYPKDT